MCRIKHIEMPKYPQQYRIQSFIAVGRNRPMKRKRYVLKPRLKIFFILLFLGYFAITTFNQNIKMKEQDKRILSLNAEIEHTQSGNQDLERLIQYTESDEYIEKVARERLGWVKKGEIIFKTNKK